MKSKILIVEDETIVAADLQNKLEKLGYRVVGMATAGSEAIEMALQLEPQMILMDIHLQGDIDGIEAAHLIQENQAVPIVYLTAHSDQATLARAKLSGPLGYILKPYDERELVIQIELATFRHDAERKLHEQREWLRVTLSSIGDAVIAANSEGYITFVNPVAAILTGWSDADAVGVPLNKVFHIINEGTRLPLDNPMKDLLGNGRVSDRNSRWLLVSRDGDEIPIWSNGALMHDKFGGIQGIVLVFRDISRQRQAEKEKDDLIAELSEAINKVKLLSGLVPICASCKNIRDDEGYWRQVEEYIQNHSEARFTHGICPPCAKKLYPNIDLEALLTRKKKNKPI